jgi:hypothetical protein
MVAAEMPSSTVVFSQVGFPAVDAPAPSPERLQVLLPGATLAAADELSSVLGPEVSVLVLPYGSAFPEQSWEAIYRFLQRGGNLVVIGGRPFTRAAYRDDAGWHLRDYSVRFIRPLMIDQYQETPGSDELEFHENPEMTVHIPPFSWRRGFSPVIRLSAVDLYRRGGSAGSIDARLDSFAWATQSGRKLSAPAIQIDHYRNGFNGGRWIFVNAELLPGFYRATAAGMIPRLVEHAAQGSEEFHVRPGLPLYLPGEPVELDVTWHGGARREPLTIKITVFAEAHPDAQSSFKVRVPATGPVSLPPPAGKGLHVIEAQLLEGEQVRAIYHSAFWIQDQEFLRSGPRVSVNQDYFELDGRPMAVVGTTYMSSEVQRLYFEHPNAFVWNQDLEQVRQAGLNMIRTGWWTGWDKLCDENGKPYERTLRTLEAFLMTARKHSLPVQFNFFAFLPEVLGGVNPYLDPEAVAKQKNLITSVVERFRDVPWLAWDLINEPSISQRLWTMRPNGDAIELRAWNEWLDRRYPDRAALAAAWNVPVSTVAGTVAIPEEVEFTPRGMYVGRNSLKVYDFFLFAQETFADWVATMRAGIRATGSQQLITVGQDEGGIQDRLSPAFFGSRIDFTTNHSWWQNDSTLWNSLFAKQPGKAMLVQETGLQRELNLDETARRSPENEAALLERKIATAFIQGGGAIEWLWNTNSYMTESNETPIGAVRPDGTEKPEAAVLRGFAEFANSAGSHFQGAQRPEIAIVASQAAQFSVVADMQLEAQRKAVRALLYHVRMPAYAIAENQVDKLGAPRLTILPSPQALGEPAWQALLRYVSAGGNLLVTGPVERDEHWQLRHRAEALKIEFELQPLTYHHASLRLGGRTIPLSFDQQKQNWAESLNFKSGATLNEMSYGKGRIFWSSYPVELAEGTDAAADLYSYVARKSGIVPGFELNVPLTSGVLIYPVMMQDSVLFVMVSDSADDAQIHLRDRVTGATLSLPLRAQHAALALIGKRDKSIIARYGY